MSKERPPEPLDFFIWTVEVCVITSCFISTDLVVQLCFVLIGHFVVLIEKCGREIEIVEPFWDHVLRFLQAIVWFTQPVHNYTSFLINYNSSRTIPSQNHAH